MGRRLTQAESEYNVKQRCINENCELNENFIYEHSEKTILTLKCNKCGEIWKVKYYGFVTCFNGCPKCGGTKKLTQLEAEEKLNQRCIEENYEINKIFIYFNKNTKINLKCSENHIFETTFSSYINQKSGCSICRIKQQHDKQKLDINIVTETVIKRCINENCELIEKINYQNNKSHIKLKCLKCNNVWSVNYGNFVTHESGCPECKKTSQLEEKIKSFLERNNIKFIRQYSPSFIGKKSLDFYLIDYNLAIECQGKQHFTKNSFGYDKTDATKNKMYQYIINNDMKKFEECKINGLKIIYFTNEKNFTDHSDYYDDNMYFENLLTNESKLLNKIYGK